MDQKGILGPNKGRENQIGAHNNFTEFYFWSTFHVNWGK